jgi:hypothetical protein
MVSGAPSRLSGFKGKSAAMPCQLKRSISAFSAAIAVSLVTLPHEGARAESPGLLKTYDIAKDAYVYGFPMIAAYKAMYQFNIDKSSPQYKGPFNRVLSEGRVFTPKDTAIVTPNSDTPYSNGPDGLAGGADGALRAGDRQEPLLFCSADRSLHL